MFAQRAHGRQRLGLAEPAREAVDLLLDDLLGLGDDLAARAEVALHDRLQVVDVIQRDPVDVAAARVDVARHGDVDQQQRPAAALGHHQRQLLAAHDRVRRGGRGDDDVGLQQLLREFVQADDRATEALREAERAVGVTVGDEDRADALVCERLRGQLARLTRAEQHHAPLGQVAEHVLGEVHGHRGHGHARGADAGLRAHALARRQGRCEQAVGQRAGRAGLHRRLVGALDLTLDLGLAEDHRLQARGHAIQLAGRLAVARRVDLLGKLRGTDACSACQ